MHNGDTQTRCLVGGQWIGNGVDPVTDPATGEVIAHVPRFGRAEADQANAAAKAAFWSLVRPAARERSVILRRWFDPSYGIRSGWRDIYRRFSP